MNQHDTTTYRHSSANSSPSGANGKTGSPRKLKEIRAPIQDHLQEFRGFYKNAIHTNVFVLDQIVRYLLRLKGKELRPTIVIMAARMFGPINQRSYVAATMIELLHSATLIHDDVVDESNKRRGFLSINKLWNNKAGVLLGDFLLSKGLLVALEHDEFTMLKVLSKAVKSMSEGELRQLKASKLHNMTEARYFQIISEKTASLFAACCECGTLSVSDDPELHKKMHHLGMNMGIAFQIRDDLFDYGIDDVGKPRRNDIKESKVTLPLIKALQQSGKREIRQMRSLMSRRKKSRSDINRIVNFVNEKDGIESARKEMNQYADKALNILDDLPDSAEKQAFAELILFIVNRSK